MTKMPIRKDLISKKVEIMYKIPLTSQRKCDKSILLNSFSKLIGLMLCVWNCAGAHRAVTSKETEQEL